MINILRKKGNLLVTLSKKNKQLLKNLVETLKNVVDEIKITNQWNKQQNGYN